MGWFGRMLTFELEADAAALTLADLLDDVSRGAISCDAERSIKGYAAHGADVRGAIEPLGNELIQFGRAEPIAPRRFKLSRLLRGRRGTEWAMAGQAPGESFAMVAANALRPIEIALASLGASVSVQARGLGDGASRMIASRVASGAGLKPPSPVHPTAKRRGDGGLDLRWVRRSRSGWAWLDSVEAPVGESVERYHVRLIGASATIELESSTPSATLTAAEVAVLGTGSAAIAVRQVGDFGSSREAGLTILLS